MAELPDVDTTQVSFLAYWNAIDQGGVAEVAPDEVLSDTNIESYTLYDNGIAGDYTLNNGRTARFRVKTDGWFVVYIDRTENFNQNTTDISTVRGPWDFLHAWNSNSSQGDIQGNALEGAISNLKDQLSNSGSITYNAPDSGLYNYEYDTATTLTLLSGTGDGSPEFSYTSPTTRHYHVLTGAGEESTVTTGYGQVIYDGTTVAQGQSSIGCLDILGNNLAPDPETAYATQLGDGPNQANHVILWS